jgi:hypothetical protein
MMNVISDFHRQRFDEITGVKHIPLNHSIQLYVIDRLIHFAMTGTS